MKRWLSYIAILAAVAVLGGKASAGTDVGRLQPVQVVYLTCERGQVIIETDTGDWGAGEDLEAAFENIKATSAREVFLETADYLLLSQNCEGLLNAMMKKLRPSCAVALTNGEPDMAEVGAFLRQHPPETTLMRCRAGEDRLHTLVTREGRMELVS